MDDIVTSFRVVKREYKMLYKLHYRIKDCKSMGIKRNGKYSKEILISNTRCKQCLFTHHLETNKIQVPRKYSSVSQSVQDINVDKVM